MTARCLPSICVLAATLAAMPALAQQGPAGPLQEPILRIDPGMHTAPIKRVGGDAACTLLATGSDDKTVRLWRVPDGRLLRTLRPPIGAGHDGKIFSVAMAPDGSWLGAGGWSTNGAHYVYIFQPSTGAMLARLNPSGNIVNHLAISPDGRYLAAILQDGNGIRVWEKGAADATSWQLVARDTEYGGQDAYGGAFDRTGALFTVADDGKLRRYAPGFRDRPSMVTVRGGRLPFSVAVHPSGDTVAVGYDDTTAVDAYDAHTLAWRFSADTTGATAGNLAAVAWSPDGRRLFAGGRFGRVLSGHDDYSILSWDWGGKGRVRELRGTQNSIVHLLPCGSNIALGASDPTFGLLTSDGSRVTWREGVKIDFRDQRGLLAVAADGRRVRFGLERGGARAVLFDLVAEQLWDAPNWPGDLAAAETTSLPVTAWVNDRKPKLGGVPITLEKFEEARSLAIALDAQKFVLGGDWSLRGYDRTGKPLWQKQTSVVWGVNIPKDGKMVIAAYGDGTIRWHRLSDGEELLALFVHKVDRRWVAWTPKGYYMASPGAESLIGWHVNRGWDEAAQFYPADRFRAQFNRPDIVKLALNTLDEDRAIEAANSRANIRRAEEDVRKIAPPIVVIQSPGDGATFRTAEVTIEYDVFSPSGGKTTNVQYFVNNAALRSLFEPPASSGKFTFSGRATLTLQPEDTTISVVAYEGERASEPVSIRLRWDGAKPGQAALPRLRALFVGVDAYASPKLNRLSYAAKDAKDLADFFTAQEGKSYRKVEKRLLTDAKRLDVIDALEWLQKGSEEGDINLLFLAGHGATIEQEFYYMAADSEPDKARGTAVSRDDIQRTISRRKGTMVVMLDACRSGAGTDATGASPVDMNRAPNELGDKSSGVLLYASASGRQYSYERPEWGNGAFTRAMLDGLAGKADIDKNGSVETDELDFYVRRRVVEMTRSQQQPVRVKPDAAPEMKLVLLK